MLPTIWDDIDNEAEAILITDVKYDLKLLSDIIYEIIDDKEYRHQVLRQNRLRGLYTDLDSIREHRDSIEKDEDVSKLIQILFRSDEISSITPLDRVYINAYYRRLLRAKVENDFKGKELVPGLVITKHTNSVTDAALVKTLRLLRLMCNYLGIPSTTEPSSFSIERLYAPAFWTSISEKFIPLFGEICESSILHDDESVEKDIHQSRVLLFLNVIFHVWSGSSLLLSGTQINVNPATYINRLLSKLK